MAAVGLLLAAASAAADPASFGLRVGKQYDTWPTYVMEQVPTTVQVDALDADGNVDTSWNGTATIEGVYAQRGEHVEPLGTIGPFHQGKLLLSGDRTVSYLVRGTQVTVTAGGASGTVSVSPLPAPGWTSLLPPLVAIVLSVITRQVFLSLLLGVMLGAYLVFQYGQDTGGLTFFLRTLDAYLPFVVGYNAVILLFTFGLGGLIALMARSGGTAGLVHLLAPLARSPRSGQITTWLLGLAVFFDDYANCYIVGPLMRARTDLLRISREKLAYIVDSTAAPIASIMVVSTWVGVEIGYIEDALGIVGKVPEGEGLRVFWLTMPYRFYPLLAILMVLFIALLRRDFGPMLRAERRALHHGKPTADGSRPMTDKDLDELMGLTSVQPRVWNALVPLCVLVSIVLGSVIYSVRFPADALDSTVTFLWATGAACVVAVGMVVGARLMTVQAAIDTWITGAKSMVLACSILILAWAIGQVCKDLHTGDYVVSLTRDFLSPRWVPLLTFTLAAVISFATGTSYGTMAILMPITVPLAWSLTSAAGLDPATAETLRIGTIGSVLAGAIFGDHCSPISDTTIMSSLGAGCDHLDHVRTQIPYALVCGALAMVGCLLVGLGLSAWLALALGIAGVLGSLLIFGRRADELAPGA